MGTMAARATKDSETLQVEDSKDSTKGEDPSKKKVKTVMKKHAGLPKKVMQKPETSAGPATPSNLYSFLTMAPSTPLPLGTTAVAYNPSVSAEDTQSEDTQMTDWWQTQSEGRRACLSTDY